MGNLVAASVFEGGFFLFLQGKLSSFAKAAAVRAEGNKAFLCQLHAVIIMKFFNAVHGSRNVITACHGKFPGSLMSRQGNKALYSSGT